MAIHISGKGIDIGAALRGRIEVAVERLLERYFDVKPVRSAVTLSREGGSFRVDVQIDLSSNTPLRAHALAADAYNGVNEALAHLTRRLRRYKRLQKNRYIASPTAKMSAAMEANNPDGKDLETLDLEPLEAHAYVIEAEVSDPVNDGRDDEGHSLIIAENPTMIAALSVPDAVLQLESTHQPVIVFRNPIHGNLNVVYRRRDGAIGWVDPIPPSAS